ncbi:MAG: VanW family protein [Clostridia bacterium]|nr:VanW family protein [Clostridia bacterium]
MTDSATAGVVRPQPNTEAAPARDWNARRTASSLPNRSAEEPFAAANGTLRFASDRRPNAAAQQGEQTRAASASSRGAQSRSSSAKSTSSQKRSGSGGSNQPPKKRRRKRKKTRRLLFIAAGFLVFAVIVLVTSILLAESAKGCNPSSDVPASIVPDASAEPIETPIPVTDETVIAYDAVIEGVRVRDLTVAEARARVKAAMQEKRESFDITVSYETYDPLMLSADTIGLTYSEDTLEEALESAARGNETAVTLPMTFDGELMRNALYALNDKIPNHAVNASVTVKWKTNKVGDVKYQQPYWDFTAGTNGAKIDFTDLENQITEAIESGDYTASLTPKVTVSEPEITLESLQSQLTLLGSYTTSYYFKGSTSTDAALVENRMGRDANITKAIGMMQVTKMDPGSSFSFNKKTGDRTEKKGWSLANAIQDQTYTKEPGGGVCQVSTTIFNAILRSGITHITRRGHSIPSDYVTKEFRDGLGFDATVDSNHIDFSFKNDTGHTIYMFIYISKNKESSRKKNINVEIYGQAEEGVEYRCRNEIIEEIFWKDDPTKIEYEEDKTLPAGKQVQIRNAHDGYRVITYVDKYKNGAFVKTVRTEETFYKPIYPKYKIGVAAETPVPTKSPKPTSAPYEDPDF